MIEEVREYDDGSNVSNAVGALIKAVQMDRRA